MFVMLAHGPYIFTGSVDKTIGVWDAASGELVRRLEAHFDWVYSLRVSADGKTLFSGGWSGV